MTVTVMALSLSLSLSLSLFATWTEAESPLHRVPGFGDTHCCPLMHQHSTAPSDTSTSPTDTLAALTDTPGPCPDSTDPTLTEAQSKRRELATLRVRSSYMAQPRVPDQLRIGVVRHSDSSYRVDRQRRNTRLISEMRAGLERVQRSVTKKCVQTAGPHAFRDGFLIAHEI